MQSTLEIIRTDPKAARAVALCLSALAGQRSRLRRFHESILSVPLDSLHKLRVEFCADEKTGRRYGKAKCRVGRCIKLGHTTYRNQVWLVWS